MLFPVKGRWLRCIFRKWVHFQSFLFMSSCTGSSNHSNGHHSRNYILNISVNVKYGKRKNVKKNYAFIDDLKVQLKVKWELILTLVYYLDTFFFPSKYLNPQIIYQQNVFECQQIQFRL